MLPKYRHQCERCGLEAELERVGRYRDDDYYELFHELMLAERKARSLGARLEYSQMCLRLAREDALELRRIIRETLNEPVGAA